MQNRNNTIEERLQILNDYIQRTIDALNMTRQVAQGLTSTNYQPSVSPTTFPGGLSHTQFVPFGVQGVQQFVQTPHGLVPVSSLNAQISGVPQIGYGMNYGWNYGLNHAQFVPAQIAQWPMSYNQIGLSQLGQIPNLGYGWNTGLNHSQFLPAQLAGFPMQQWPVNVPQQQFVPQFGVSQFVPQHNVSQLGVNQIVPQGVPGQTTL
jgi:hypothetical protein